MQRALNMIGLCARARRMKSGLDMSEQAIKRGEVALALVDDGASDGAKKTISDACIYKGVAMRILPSGTLGAAIGKPGRMAVVIMDRGFADRIAALID